MSVTLPHTAQADERRARIEAVLGVYPNVDAEELADLLHWFRTEASPLEVGFIASNPDLAKPYQRLKADHLDRLRGADLMRAAIVVLMIAAGIVALLLWRVT